MKLLSEDFIEKYKLRRHKFNTLDEMFELIEPKAILLQDGESWYRMVERVVDSIGYLVQDTRNHRFDRKRLSHYLKNLYDNLYHGQLILTHEMMNELPDMTQYSYRFEVNVEEIGRSNYRSTTGSAMFGSLALYLWGLENKARPLFSVDTEKTRYSDFIAELKELDKNDEVNRYTDLFIHLRKQFIYMKKRMLADYRLGRDLNIHFFVLPNGNISWIFS